MESSLCEKPERHAPRRLSDYLMLEGQKQKVHSLVDKVYSRKNLKLAWERVRANRVSIGVGSGPRIGIQKGPPRFTFRAISVRSVGAGRGCGDGASAG